VCKWVRLACKRHLDDLKKATKKAYPYRFDQAKAERVCRFIELLPHIKAEWAKKSERIQLQGWQCFKTAALFGWVRKHDNLRRFARRSSSSRARMQNRGGWSRSLYTHRRWRAWC
jgi:phage terminase large subunit-like protein